MSLFDISSEAYRAARARASIATYLEASTLHTAIVDARGANMTIRETAAALQVHRSTVGRHWNGNHPNGDGPPVWGTAELYMEAERAIWAHAPEQAAQQPPFEWIDMPDGSRHIRAVSSGFAVLDPDSWKRTQDDQ